MTLRLAQPRRGHRFGLDPFLLAAFARPRPRERIADLGAGVGVIGLLLASRHPAVRVTAVELDPQLAGLARANVVASGLGARCDVLEADLRDAPALLRRGSFDRVVANPPHGAAGAGRRSPDPGRALARQESGCGLAELAASAAALLRPGGALDLIHVPWRLPEILRTLGSAGLETKTLRLVVPLAGAAPRLLLLSARRGGRPGLTILPELAIRDTAGCYGTEVAAALAPAAS